VWKKILKFEIRNFNDARRAGKEYALEDYYETMVLSEEEYQNLSNRKKQNLHQKLENQLKIYGKNSWAEERKKFHGVMRMRVQYGKETTMLPTEDYKAQKRRPNRPKEEIEAERQGREQRRQEREQRKTTPKPPSALQLRNQRRERGKTTSPMILDYFKMWKNMYNRLPTLTEITNAEGRPLTIDEETTFGEQYARETQE